jgi:hypothetical protein
MKQICFAAVVLSTSLLLPNAFAHGGLAMDQDKCKLTLGRYRMHFAGYQLDAQRSEFCEDIPHAGETIIVLDAVDDALRDLPIEVVIARAKPDSNEPGETVFRLAPLLYPKGTLTLQHNFKENGNYIGLVYAGNAREHSSVFPFSVGRDRTWITISGSVVLLIAMGLGAYRFGLFRLKKSIAEASKK